MKVLRRYIWLYVGRTERRELTLTLTLTLSFITHLRLLAE